MKIQWLVPLLLLAPISQIYAEEYNSAPLTTPDSTRVYPVAIPIATTYNPPQIEQLPTSEPLNTIRISNKTYHIRTTPSGIPSDFRHDVSVRKNGLSLYQDTSSALFFAGTSSDIAVSGIKSSERLIIENCTFILELDRPDTWDEKAVAISVHGYREVIIRKCEFFVRNTKSSVERNAIASVLIYDCLKVLVEDCYFEGRTSWFRGHVLLYCTEIGTQKLGTVIRN